MIHPQQHRTSWAQPSLSRDFALLSAAIIFFMLAISASVAWITYSRHSERIIAEMDKETRRIERTLEMEINNTGFLLNAIGRQIVQAGAEDHNNMAQTLRSFATGSAIYAIWSWSDVSHRVVVSSNKGVLETPINVADRDYVQRAEAAPWQLHIGTPVEGRTSGRWIIPIGMGLSDATGKYVGTLAASVDISALTEQISNIVKREGISFAIVSKTFVPLTMVADNEHFLVSQLPLHTLAQLDLNNDRKGVISRGGLFTDDDIYSYYFVSEKYPYIIVVGYDANYSDSAMRSMLWPRLIQIMVVAAFLLSFLWIIRTRVIKPVIELGAISADVAAGGRWRPLTKSGPMEIEHLSTQVSRISDYITERRLLEEELRSKIGGIQQRLQQLQMQMRSRAVLLAGLLGEYKHSLKSINGYAQVMKDQLYGPIENKKYRQYATDIHQTGTTLELMVRKLIALSRVDASSVVTREEKLSLATVAEGARRFVQEAQAELQPISVQVDLGEQEYALLIADSLHFQQALAYTMLYVAAQFAEQTDWKEECQLQMFARKIQAARAQEPLLILIGYGRADMISDDMIRDALTALQVEHVAARLAEEPVQEQLHVAMAQAMLSVQDMALALIKSKDIGLWALVYVPFQRLYLEEPEYQAVLEE